MKDFSKFWSVARRECVVRMRKPGFWLLALVGPVLLFLMSIVPYALHSDVRHQEMLINTPAHWNLVFPLKIGSYNVSLSHDASHDAQVHFLSGEWQVLCDFDEHSGQWFILKKEQWHPADSLNVIRTLAAFNEKNTAVNCHVTQIAGEDREFPILQQTLALLAAILVYFFLFTYSVALMKGVMEEKSNKVMDLILSSVSPVAWIIGKISGIGLASLVQFTLWIVISYVPFQFFKNRYGKALDLFSPEHIHATLQHHVDAGQALGWYDVWVILDFMPWAALITVMLIAMLCGFIIYAALFAVVGMLAGKESDAQPYVLPITSPLILSFLISGIVIAEPYGVLAQWLSVIPFTAPVTLALRAGLGVSIQELFLPLLLQMISALFMMVLAGRLYKKIINRGGSLGIFNR